MSHPAQRRAQATSFGTAAAAYERGRPPYPEEAIDWLIPPGAGRAVDLGAGTGKLSRQLVRRGLEVIAVEPSAGMREQFHRAVPEAVVTAGSGELIPLAGQSVDVVLAAQAWHWVDPALAVPEVARVLVPGGRLGVLWNLRDERTGWVAELSALMHVRESPDLGMHEPEFGPPFGPVERLDLEWVFELDRSALTDYVASRSYVITLPEAERAGLLEDVRRLADTHPALAGAERVSMPQITRCTRACLQR
jgi:SAM-dependent methyltransferase